MGGGEAAQCRLHVHDAVSMVLMAEGTFLCSDVPFLPLAASVAGDPTHRQHLGGPKLSPHKEFPSPWPPPGGLWTAGDPLVTRASSGAEAVD